MEYIDFDTISYETKIKILLNMKNISEKDKIDCMEGDKSFKELFEEYGTAYDLYVAQYNCDFQVKICETTYNLHKKYVSKYSKYFEKINTDYSEIEMKCGVIPFENLIEYLYTGKQNFKIDIGIFYISLILDLDIKEDLIKVIEHMLFFKCYDFEQKATIKYDSYYQHYIVTTDDGEYYVNTEKKIIHISKMYNRLSKSPDFTFSDATGDSKKFFAFLMFDIDKHIDEFFCDTLKLNKEKLLKIKKNKDFDWKEFLNEYDTIIKNYYSYKKSCSVKVYITNDEFEILMDLDNNYKILNDNLIKTLKRVFNLYDY